MDYKVSLETCGQMYKAESETLEKAIANLPVSYVDIVGDGEITVSKGDKEHKRFFFMKPLKALLANEIRRAGYTEQMEFFLK